MMNAIDVSRHQGTIDWARVRAAGIRYAMLRAGYGSRDSQKDVQFERNYTQATANGVNVGAYWYSYATSAAEALQEAQCCLRAIAGKQLTLPVAYDIEYEPCILALTNAQRTEMVKTFLGAIEAAGYYGILYASTDFIRNRLNYKDLTRYDVWAAQYSTACTCPLPYGMWQNSSTGKVDGISGNVDLDIIYKDYPTIIKAAGLNGWPKTCGNQPAGDGSNAEQDREPESLPQPEDTPCEDIWATNGPWLIAGATGADKARLRALVEELSLPCVQHEETCH